MVEAIQNPCPSRAKPDKLSQFETVPHRKSPANPVIDGTSVDSTQSYPPSVVRVEGAYYAVVKSYPNLVLLTSDDGVHWEEDGTLVTANRPWRNRKVSRPLLRYDPATSRYHLYYAAKGTSGFSIGYLSTDAPLAADGERRKDTQLYTTDDYRREMDDDSVLDVFLSDMLVVDGRVVYYGNVRDDDGSHSVWVGTGEAWTDIRPEKTLFDHSHPRVVGTVMQMPNVIEMDGTFLMSYTAGIRADVIGERQVYLAVGESYDSVTPVKRILVPHGSCGDWDERRTYASQWLKVQDGSYTDPEIVDGRVRLYYSGHDTGTSGVLGNRGKTGLVEYDVQTLRTLASEMRNRTEG